MRRFWEAAAWLAMDPAFHPANRIPASHLADSPPRPLSLIGTVRQRLRVKHYSARTEEAYVQWVRRFVLFHDRRHPRTMGSSEIAAFVTHLATVRRVSSATQNQAVAAVRPKLRIASSRDAHAARNAGDGEAPAS